MELRDGLLILGVILVLAFMADLARRLLARNRLRIKIDKRFQNLPEPDLSAELPGGGKARVIRPGESGAASVHREPTFDPDSTPLETSAGDRVEPSFNDSESVETDPLLDGSIKGVGEARTLLAHGEDDGILGPVRVRPADEMPAAGHADDQREVAEESDEPDLVAEPEQDLGSLPAGEETATAPEQPEEPEPMRSTDPDSAALKLLGDPEPAIDLMRPVAEILQEVGKDPVAESDALPAEEVNEEEPATEEVAAENSVDEALTAGASDGAEAASEADEPAEPEAGEELAAKELPAAEDEPEAAPKARDARPKRGRPEVQPSLFDELGEPPVEPARGRGKGKRAGGKRKAEGVEEPLDEVLWITVMARSAPFSGRLLFRLVEACGMTFDDKMAIYHRHEDGDGVGAVQFSMVNALQPGTFDPAQAEHFRTQGVSLFLDMRKPSRLMEAFDCMLATAQCIADNLDGELRDDQRSTLRNQTVEHYRSRIRDFERRRLAGRI